MPELDARLFLWINATTATPAWLLTVARWLSTDLPVLAAGGLWPLACGGRAQRRQLLGACLAMALGWVAVRGMREAVHVSRPSELGLGLQWLAHAATAGFPSFHATVAGAWAAGLAAFAPRGRRRWALIAGTIALSVAWSRVFLGLHFVSDAAAGLVLGVACALTAREGLAWLHRRRTRIGVMRNLHFPGRGMTLQSQPRRITACTNRRSSAPKIR